MSRIVTTSLTVNGRRQTVRPQKLAIQIPQSLLISTDKVIE